MAQMVKEVLDSSTRNNVRTVVPLPPRAVQIISQRFPLVLSCTDLDSFSARLQSVSGDEEFGFSVVFDPVLVEHSCQRGIFPMALKVHEDIFVYAPKLHRGRSVTRLANDIKWFPVKCNGDEGRFVGTRLKVPKKLLREPNSVGRTPSFSVFVNRASDMASVLALIHAQHGENWLCKQLRACMVHMFANMERYRTKVVVIAVRRHCYDSGEMKHNSHCQQGDTHDRAHNDMVMEGDLVAGEIGFIVGDIYCSATGAYSVSGAGALQLAVTGEVMRTVGCTIWDLGMSMPYKDDMLGCVPLQREDWIKLVLERAADPTLAECIERQLRERYATGAPVRQLLVSSV
ncbi:putative Leucyl phenylalanyl tRNA protein transferase [Trypanosoma vivax]|nr:hypothetical protein TRVL_09101 [Trypanosoma vivax]KAH8618448.1 putative Leucyl phenylalanyl tRNA protein transferase [Trypanosoma vivax]